MLTDRAAAADSPRMDPVVLSAFLLAEAAAVTSLLLLRRSRRRASAASVQPAPSAVPDPPVVEALSPAFITTNSGRRYHLGCLTGDGGLRYAVWTARSHELVRLFDCTEAGWRAAWDLFQRVERDRSPEWIDLRGARRSRREWLNHREPSSPRPQ